MAQPAGDGQAAFDGQDFQQAEALWRAEAARGSAQAMFGLGLLHDLGLGRARDPAAALQWYLQAAGLGLADAQFNAAVMLDSGIGMTRQPQAAAAWYGRAAAQGHARASYNLALLFASGDGVPRNADLARLWLSAARDDLAAAAEYLRNLAQPRPDDRILAAPVALGGGIVPGHAELVWAAAPAPEDTDFRFEIIGRPAPGAAAAMLSSGGTEASAVRPGLGETGSEMAWRVYRTDSAGMRYAATPWQVLGNPEQPPAGLLRIEVAASDAAAQRFAAELLPVFDHAGYWTEIRTYAGSATETRLFYGYPQDAALARELAAFLPGLAPDAVRRRDGALPGMVILRLVGGPGA